MPARHFIAAWGILGTIVFLCVAVVRLFPLAVEPLNGGMSPLQIAAYAASVIFMAYSEGYRGFQKAFSPRVVVRAYWVADNGGPVLTLLAPVVAFGLLHGTRKRLITSWSVVGGVALLVILVGRVAQPWRGIIDAGVVVGLTWGIIAIVVFWVHTALGRPPQVPLDVPQG